MIGSALKKLAAQHGMTVSNGVAYGNLKGYAVTLCEGSGYKRIDISTRFADAANQDALRNAANAVNLQRTYRVQTLEFGQRYITVIFGDAVGTMKKIHAFIDWFFPLMAQYHAAGANCCAECGQETTGGKWVLIDGIAHYMHVPCAERVKQEITEAHEQEKSERRGSYLTGLIGALIGAALGAVVWALVLTFGYVASIVGLLIGFLAQKGYNLLRGKQGKGKIVILIIAIIFGVLLGTFAADAIALGQMINAGELPGWSYGEIPMMILILMEDAEYVSGTLSNIGLGLLFAAIGVFAMLKKAGKDVSGTKITDLK